MQTNDNTSEPFDFDAAMAELEVDPKQAPIKGKVAEQKLYPCEICSGKGKLHSLYGSRTCPSCKGKKFFKNSPATRRKWKEDAIRCERAKLDKKKAAFQEQNPGLVEFLRENCKWSDFFGSLLDSFGQHGGLTENQVRAARASMEKIIQSRKEQEQAREEKRVVVDLATIKEMFNKAVSSGLKRTKYRAEGLELTRAPDTGRNPGAIYVNRIEDGEYVGKVINGKFEPVRSTVEEDKLAILRIAENPREAAVRWGKQTGTCSCCGRELTNAASIALGIGPICADKWGL